MLKQGKGKLDAITDARLKQAVDEAKGKYDTEVKTQEANRNNQSLAARNRTWAPSN